MIERIYTLSYYHHQIGSMNYYPMFEVRSWNNGMRCMSLYILTYYSNVIMNAMVLKIPSLTIVNSTVYSGANQRKHQSSASLAFVRGIHRSPMNSPHKGPVTRKMFLHEDVIMHFRHRLRFKFTAWIYIKCTRTLLLNDRFIKSDRLRF